MQPTIPLRRWSQGLEEIVVTAARREQSELTVPISLTAFSAKDLEANHVTDVEDYFAQSPDVYITGAPDRVGLVSSSFGLEACDSRHQRHWRDLQLVRYLLG